MTHAKFIIIGAGISGLALGWYLKKRFPEDPLLILEAQDRPGGWIRTRHTDGFLFEEGPHSCRSKGAGLDTLQLIEELGLDSDVIAASPDASKRFLYLNGRLQAVPNSLFSFLRSPMMKGVISALWKEWRTPPSLLEDETIAAFIERRFSKDIAEHLVDPLVSGIYAGDMEQLSIRSCFPKLHEKEHIYGSILKGMWKHKKQVEDRSSPFIETFRKIPMFSFKNGMEALAKALQNYLKNQIRLSSSVKRLHHHSKGVMIELQTGETLFGNKVFLAVPAYTTAGLIKHMAPELAEEIHKTRYTTIAAVNMGWNKKVLPVKGFGYLIPTSQKQKILGVIFDSSVFPEQNTHPNQTRLTVMMGGAHHPEVAHRSEKAIQELAQQTLSQHLKINSFPDSYHCHLARQAIPQYEVGHHKRLAMLETSLASLSQSRLYILGSAWYGVSINDCIANAKATAAQITT